MLCYLTSILPTNLHLTYQKTQIKLHTAFSLNNLCCVPVKISVNYLLAQNLFIECWWNWHRCQFHKHFTSNFSFFFSKKISKPNCCLLSLVHLYATVSVQFVHLLRIVIKCNTRSSLCAAVMIPSWIEWRNLRSEIYCSYYTGSQPVA